VKEIIFIHTIKSSEKKLSKKQRKSSETK